VTAGTIHEPETALTALEAGDARFVSAAYPDQLELLVATERDT
jgi:hypothetical protein